MNSGEGVYRLVVRDELSDRFATQFDGLELTRIDGNTVLTGVVSDQAHLISLIQQVQSLGLELISVGEVPDASQGGPT
jgi:hypothetical protein